MNINTFRGTALALRDCSVKDSVLLSEPDPLPSLPLGAVTSLSPSSSSSVRGGGASLSESSVFCSRLALAFSPGRLKLAPFGYPERSIMRLAAAAAGFSFFYVPNPNRCSYWMEVAFLALDSESLGEHVEDAYHYDFGDNIFPQYKQNTKTKSVFEEDGSDEDLEEDNALNRKTISKLSEFIP